MTIRPVTFLAFVVVAFVLGLLCGRAVFGQTPAAELQTAIADLETRVPPPAWPTTRYLSLSNVPRQRWDEASAAVSLTLNLVSRSARLARPETLPGTGGRMLRIDLAWYGLPAAVWEAMVSSGEPYWHVRTQAAPPGKPADKPVTVYTDGGWVGLETAARLREKTQSGGAVARADWFVAKAITTVDGGFYYELTGIADFADANSLYEHLGIDFKASDRLNAEAWSLLVRSDVTNKFRRVIRRQGALGGAWKTEDSIDETAEEDPLRNPLGRRHDASEHVLAKQNGLPLFALFDRDGKPVDVAPQNLATDHTAAHGDGQLAPALSCLACHREDLLRPLGNDLRRLLARDVEAYFARAEDAEKASAFYERDMQLALRRDREDFAAAVAAVSGGLEASEVAGDLVTLYRSYAFEPVTPERARAELGLRREQVLREVWGQSIDPVLLALCEGISVQRKQWEASFAEAAMLTASAFNHHETNDTQ